jgi:hypothetical protein
VDGERAQLGGSVLVAVDDAHPQAVTRQLGRHQQAGRPGPDDERVHGARTYTTAWPARVNVHVRRDLAPTPLNGSDEGGASGRRGKARAVMNRVSDLSASG